MVCHAFSNFSEFLHIPNSTKPNHRKLNTPKLLPKPNPANLLCKPNTPRTFRPSVYTTNQPHNNFTPTHYFNFFSPSLNAAWGTSDYDFLREVLRQDGTEVERGFFQSFNEMLQGGSSSGQSSIDNIQPEEPRYPIRDIRRRGCGTNGHL